MPISSFLHEAPKKVYHDIPEDILTAIVCDRSSHTCMSNTCSECDLLKGFDMLVESWLNELTDDEKEINVRLEQ
jgi:hypothetical protein